MRKNILFSFCFLIMIIIGTSGAALAASAAAEDVPVSYGLYVLAEDNAMAMAGVKGNKISFEADDFARAMNLAGVDSITVTEIPPISDGELLVGSTVVNEGQKITGANIGLMSYNSKSDTTASSYFKFRLDGCAYDIRCNLYMLDEVNHAPTLSVASETSLNVSTHQNITLYGNLSAYDPDGDELTIEVVSYPKSGILVMTDSAQGSYTYTPGNDYTGKDSFRYVARDKYGNYSEARTVNLSVNRPKTSVVYEDMNGSKHYNAALDVTEAGIMNGTQIGNSLYFYPERSVTRGEFLTMAMKAIGIERVSPSSSTLFYDDAEISNELKGYVSTAYELGYIDGAVVDGKLCFLPNQPISRADAAVMVCNMIDAATPTITPTFDDSEDIPAYAKTSVLSLNYMGILHAEDKNICATDDLSREEAAHILSLMIEFEK